MRRIEAKERGTLAKGVEFRIRSRQDRFRRRRTQSFQPFDPSPIASVIRFNFRDAAEIPSLAVWMILSFSPHQEESVAGLEVRRDALQIKRLRSELRDIDASHLRLECIPFKSSLD